MIEIVSSFHIDIWLWRTKNNTYRMMLCVLLVELVFPSWYLNYIECLNEWMYRIGIPKVGTRVWMTNSEPWILRKGQ